jgi:hypothetical protein
MQKRFCDKPNCGRPIEGHELARQPAQVQIEGIGLVTIAFTFPSTKPDLCNCCLLDAAATLDPRKNSGVVLPFSVQSKKS